MQERNWNDVKQSLPELDEFVIKSVRNNNYFYHEILKRSQDTNVWINHQSVSLSPEIKVVGWMELPSCYLG